MRTMFELLREYLHPGDCFIDIGAKNGVASALVASDLVGPAGVVFAFEPDRQRFQRLRHNVAFKNKSNIRCFNVFSSDRCSDAPDRERNAMRIDALCRAEQLNNISLIKISAPGAELATMSGIGELIFSRNPPNIIFDMDYARYLSRDVALRLEDLLIAADYRVRHCGSFIVATAPAVSARALTRSRSLLHRFSKWCKVSPRTAEITHA